MVTFEDLWASHPVVSSEDDDPCSADFANQCAIRVGVALAKCGVHTKSIPGATHCWHHPSQEGHILRAEELASGLQRMTINGIAKGVRVDPKKVDDLLADQRGIIFFKDYWQRNNGQRTGDHIDLWNGSRLTAWTSWFRLQWGLSIDGFWSDFGQSKTVIFWRVYK